MWKLNFLKCASMCGVCLCTCSQVLVKMLGRQRLTSRCLPCCSSSSYILRQGFSLNQLLTHSARLAGHGAPGILCICFPNTGTTSSTVKSLFTHWVQGLKLGASASPAKPFAQAPQVVEFRSKSLSVPLRKSLTATASVHLDTS